MWTELRRACGLLPFAQSLPDADLTVYVIDVGKADAILIETPEGAVLSDCATAEQAKTVLRVLKQRNIQKLRAVWISHADSDHVGGLTQILREVPAGADRAAGRSNRANGKRRGDGLLRRGGISGVRAFRRFREHE